MVFVTIWSEELTEKLILVLTYVHLLWPQKFLWVTVYVGMPLSECRTPCCVRDVVLYGAVIARNSSKIEENDYLSVIKPISREGMFH